jgi:cell division protease FtsH
MNLKPQKSDNKTPRIPWVWLILLLAIIIWNLVLFVHTGEPQADIPYTTFLKYVDQNNVASVNIQGDQITGDFVNPILWPQPTPSPTPDATPGSTPSPTSANAPALAASTPVTYTSFLTTFPEAVGDPNLLALLEDHKVVVNVKPPPTPWFTLLLTDGLPVLLMILLFFWIGRQAVQSQDGIFNFGRSRARSSLSGGIRPNVTFNDVAGEDQAKAELEEVVDFLREPKKYHDLGARIPRGVLLVGPPGTGKTLMARAVAGEASVPFFNLSASEFVEMFVGVGASRVRDLFDKAKATAPSIVFIDELDAVGRRRGAGLGSINDEREQTLNQLLVEMDGFDEHHEVILLAATNRPDVLDPALLRPGRFDRQVTVEFPDRKGREGILRIHTRDLHLSPDVDLEIIARSTTGFSGADLANLCNESALAAARHNHEQILPADFDEALDRVLLGQARPALIDPNERRVVAYHESGHALAAWLTPLADPVYKVTIVPHGRALGVTEQVPGEDHYNYNHEYLVARLDVMLGGRTAEEVALGTMTSGAENDLVEATKLARRMITRWGMGSLGPVAFQADEEQPFLGYEISQGRDYSETTAARIDQDVQQMLAERHEAVRHLLADAREQLDQLAQRLLKEESIDREVLTQILGERTEDAQPAQEA